MFSDLLVSFRKSNRFFLSFIVAYSERIIKSGGYIVLVVFDMIDYLGTVSWLTFVGCKFKSYLVGL